MGTQSKCGATGWVYKRTEPALWTVGHYAPDGVWYPESDWPSSEAAAERVHWLNGGQRTEVER